MIPGATGAAPRTRPDPGVDEASAGDEARRVRPRTQGAGEALPGLSPRRTMPDASMSEPPRRSLVSAGQLQQWQSRCASPSSALAEAGPAVAHIAAAQAGPSSSRAAGPAGGPPNGAEALQAFEPQGRNTLLVYSAERALRQSGASNADMAKFQRLTLAHFANALLQQQPPLALDAFMERLASPDTARRDAAIALRTAYENEQKDSATTRTVLATCFQALSALPPERRLITLDEMLLRGTVARTLKTLLPAADHGLLQQVQAAEVTPGGRAALENQALLIRVGVALRAQGHGGLSGWLRMQQQPDGARLATQVLDRIKNGPELHLGQANKKRLDQAAEKLRKCSLDKPPRGALPAASPPGATGATAASPQASPGVARASAATRSRQSLPPSGRNTLVVLAAERALQRTDMSRQDGTTRHGTTLGHLGDALLRRQPALTLDAFLDRLLGPDPAQRDAAAALKTAHENEQTNPALTRSLLNACVKALSEVPREQRMLTLEQALPLKLTRTLKTLLPEEDLRLLQQVQAARDTGARETQRKQFLLIRLGVLLTARGHGGLAGWVQMHRQPGGARLADELLDRLKNDPQLKVGNWNRAQFDRAVADLRACALGEAGASALAAAPGSRPSTPADAQDDLLQGFAESLEHSLMSPAHAAPTADAADDFPLFDPGTPTTGDLALLAPLQPTGHWLPPSAAVPHDDPLRGFAESLERSLMSPAPSSPTAEAAEDFPLFDPGTPTTGDLALLAPLQNTGHWLPPSAAAPHDAPLRGFAESLEHMFMSPGKATTASPGTGQD